MIEKLAQKFARWLVNNSDYHSEDDYDVFVYGAECALNEIIAEAIIFALAFLLGVPLEMLVRQLFWIPFRLNSGGFHASSHVLCIVISTILAVTCVFLAKAIVDYSWILFLELILSIVIAFTVAPVVHPNNPVSESNYMRSKKMIRGIAVVESIIIIVLFLTVSKVYASIAVMGMFSAAVFCMMGFRRTTQQVM